MRKLPPWLIVIILAGFILLCDRLSKLWVLANLQLYESWAPIPGLASIFTIFHTTNTGVAFGLFQGVGMLFTIVRAIAVVAILIYSYRLEQAPVIVYASLALMLGGAAGNLWDGLAYGHVIDFIDFRIPNVFHWATFNLADSAIVVGVLLLAAQMLLEGKQDRTLADQT